MKLQTCLRKTYFVETCLLKTCFETVVNTALVAQAQPNVRFSFTISTWVWMAADYPNTVMPIVCSLDATLCLYLKNRYERFNFMLSVSQNRYDKF